MTSIQRAGLTAGLLGLWTAPWLALWQRVVIGIALFLLGVEALMELLGNRKHRKQVGV